MTKKKQDPTAALMLLTTDLTPMTSQSRRHSTASRNPFFFPHSEEPEESPTETMLPETPFTVETPGGQSLISRRPRSQRLRPLRISGRRGVPSGRFDWCGGGDGVEEEGRELLSNFVHQQARAENPEAAHRLEIITPESYTNAKLVRIGRELRHIAQTLVDSPQRQTVRQRASQVPPTITYAEFKSLLRELFAAGGITRERIVVLFFFCADVALCSLTSRGEELCSQFLQWSMSFVSESVCAWVRSHGGWGAVMSTRFNAVTVSLMLVGAILVGYGVMKYVTHSS